MLSLAYSKSEAVHDGQASPLWACLSKGDTEDTEIFVWMQL